MNHASNAQGYSSDAIRRFLLGNLREVERALVEQRLFEDEEFEVRVRIEELALADDYARKRLSAADNERFHRRFLVTDDRYRALAVSRLLQTKLAASATYGKTETTKVRSWFDFRQPAWRYGFAVVLLLLVFVTVRRVVKEPSLVKQIIPTLILPKSKPIAQQPNEANHPVAVPAPPHAGAEPTPPPHELTAQTITLDLNNTSEHPALVPANAVANPIRMQIVPPKNLTGPFTAELLTSKGETVFKADSMVTAESAGVTFEIPAGLLKAGDYQIKVTRAGEQPNEAESYYFRVQ